MDDPDAIWKPGYDGPPPVAHAAPALADDPLPGRAERGDADERGRPTRARRRWLAAGVAVVGLALAAAVVVRDPLDSGTDADPNAAANVPAIAPPDPSVFGGPAARRLPQGAANLWSVDLEHIGDHWVEVIRRDLVIAAIESPVDVNAPSDRAMTLVALDAVDGEQRWTSRLTGSPRDVTVVGAVDDVLVLEQPGALGPAVTGVDIRSGETRWSVDDAPNAGHVGLLGTPFVARLPAGTDRFVSLIDATSGRDVGTIASDPERGGRPAGWFTDGRGTWYVIDGGEVVEYDLSSEVGEATVVGPVEEVVLPPVVVGDRIAVVDGAGSISLVGAGVRRAATASAAVPGPVRSLTPVSRSNVVVTAPGSIAGVAVEGDALDVTWSRNEGALVAEHPVEGGMLLQVATRGGAAMQLVDGLTGETLEQLTMTAGALQALVVAGDGFVALRSAQLGTELAGIGLDGTERWSILGPAPIAVGGRVVVRATSTDGRLRITAYGDPE